jgi:CheY-like chemotaxis protein
LEEIRLTALRAAQIACQLMTFTRHDNAPGTTINLSLLIAEMLDLLKVSVSKSAVLETVLAPDLPPIFANPSEIRQVVMNLITNASEALEGRAGSIIVSTGCDKPAGAGPCRAVRLEVMDNGIGMSADTRDRIFDPFYTTRFVGRGLGLSAVQGIIRRLGGSIEVESTPNRGSRFVVLLPSTVERPAAAIQRRNDAAVKPKITVLLIDDEESLRSPVGKLLRKRNFRVIEAPDGESGLDRFKADPDGIDAVLLDVTLPGMPGPAVFDELRRIRPDVNVILCTAYSEETVMAQFGAREIRGFIRKPYRTDDLVKLLGESLEAPTPSQSAESNFRTHPSAAYRVR